MKKEFIKYLTRGIPGMSNVDNLFDLCREAEDTFFLQGDFLEIGTWCGKSAIPLGHIAKELGCKLHCYDIFPPFSYWQALQIAPSTLNEIRQVYNRGGPRALLEQAVLKYKLEDVIIIHPHSFNQLDNKFRLAFIDGSHEYESLITDISFVTQCLVDEGRLILDDNTYRYPGVQRAFAELEGFTRKRKLNLKMGIAERSLVV